MVIIELAKWHVYDFHYNVIKQKYGMKITLLYTETDSLTYEIQTESVCQDLHSYIHVKFNFRN